MSMILKLACAHCCLWGIFVILMPATSARVYGFEQPISELALWKGTGLVIFLYGIGYGIAATDPERHWAVVAIGLIAKILGPIGMCWAAWRGEVPVTVLYLLPFNDVLWWYPFFRIVQHGIATPMQTLKDPQLQ